MPRVQPAAPRRVSAKAQATRRKHVSAKAGSGAKAELAGSASVFAALGDRTRLLLVARLCEDGPLSITRLSAGLSITRQGVTKHLRVMERAGIVRSTPQGREIVWQLEQERLAEVRRHLELISVQWDEVLGRLKSFVEG